MLRVVALLLLVVAPIGELWVAVQVAQAVGPGWTLLALVGASLLGLWVMRIAGASWWAALRGGHLEGRLPDGREVADAALLFLAGVLLFLPGFVSDAVGLVLLVPPVRDGVQHVVTRWFTRRFTAVTGPGGTTIWTRSTRVVRGEVVRDDDVPPGPSAPPPALPPGS